MGSCSPGNTAFRNDVIAHGKVKRMVKDFIVLPSHHTLCYRCPGFLGLLCLIKYFSWHSKSVPHQFIKELALLTSKVTFQVEKHNLDVFTCKYDNTVSAYYTSKLVAIGLQL